MTADGATVLAPKPASSGAVTRLPALRAGLERVRARWRLGAVLTGAVFALVTGLAVLCGLEGFTMILAGISDRFVAPTEHPFFDHLVLSGAAFACVLAIAFVLAFVVAPDLAALARAADRALALRERLSTALEVDASLPPDHTPDPVRCALLADAERSAAAIDPSRIVRLALPRATWAVPVLIVATVLLQLVPPDAFGLAVRPGPVAGTERDRTGLSGRQGVEAAANLRRIAELVSKDAEERSDPYLRTIARTLERLSSDAERSDVDRRALASGLDRLLAHVRQAYGQGSNAERRAKPQDVMRQLQAMRDDIAGNRQAGTATAQAPEDAAGAGSAVAAERDQAARQAAPSERRSAGRTASPEAATQELRATGRDDVLKDLDDYDVVDPRIEKERAFAEQQRRAIAASQSAGAAKDAGNGEGDRAGDGTRPLGHGGPAATTLTPGAELLLPDQGANDGRRIRIELPPDTGLSGVAPPDAGSAAGEWRRVQEQAIERPELAAEDRQVVGRYFTHSAEGRGP